jgi:hypothetical protein
MLLEFQNSTLYIDLEYFIVFFRLVTCTHACTHTHTYTSCMNQVKLGTGKTAHTV